MKNFKFSVLRSGKFVALLIFFPLWVQAQFSDDFSDGNFTENPAWQGDSSHFEVNAEKQLHLNSSGSDTSVMFTTSSRLENTEWNFFIRISFNTSVNNHCRVYLASDSLDPSIANALYLQVGGSNDSIYLAEQSKSGLKILYRYHHYITAHTTNFIRFRILHKIDNHWEMFMDTTGGTNYFQDGSFYYETGLNARWFGLFCRYTSSNATKVWFDDLYAGKIIYDTIKPRVQWVEVYPDQNLKVTFNEPVEETGALDKDNYQLHSEGNPDEVSFEPGARTTLNLRWKTPFPDGIMDSLTIGGVADLSGNMIRDTAVGVSFYKPKPYDVVINEILADPDPAVGLPPEEFIELYNITDFPLNLKGWTIHFGNYFKAIPRIILLPHEFLILSKTTAYEKYGLCVPVFTSSSSLANEGTVITLKDASNKVIHTVNYDPSWFQGNFKEEGGWTLEMLDPENPCGCGDNWLPSTDVSGGTPGRTNSTMKWHKDDQTPHLLHAYITDSVTIAVIFSEPMDSLTLVSLHHYYIFDDNARINPVNIKLSGPDYRKLYVATDQKFEKNVKYELHLRDTLTDCAGNMADTAIFTRFGFPSEIEPGDVILNEILPDPEGEGARFFELYNNSDKIADFRQLVIGNSVKDSLSGSGAVSLSVETRLAFPGDYFVFTPDPQDLEKRYQVFYPDMLIKMEQFPSMNNDSGNLTLADRSSFTLVDQCQYNKDQHFPLLTTTEGVSLERVNPDLPSGYPSNWHSAAESAGFATPGYQNSQIYKIDKNESRISIEPEIFSPDNDGKDDQAGIVIREQDPPYSLNVSIFNVKGIIVRRVATNFLGGNENIFFWDGINENGQKCNVGIYIVFVEVLYPDGKVIREKKAVVLAAQF